jgi:hypothetical protein
LWPSGGAGMGPVGPVADGEDRVLCRGTQPVAGAIDVMTLPSCARASHSRQAGTSDLRSRLVRDGMRYRSTDQLVGKWPLLSVLVIKSENLRPRWGERLG